MVAEMNLDYEAIEHLKLHLVGFLSKEIIAERTDES